MATIKRKTSKPKMRCNGKCNSEKSVDLFYKSNSPKHEVYGGYCPYCKKCLQEIVTVNGEFDKEKLKFVLKEYLDKPYFEDIFQKVISNNGKNKLGVYLRQVNMRSGRGKILTWINGDFEDKTNYTKEEKEDNKKEKKLKPKEEIPKLDKKTLEDTETAKKDVVKLLGYDPFIHESKKDQYKLYNSLIDYLDESTLEDSFKIPTVIQIVKTFNQVDKIDSALNEYMNDEEAIINGSRSINTLFNSKKNMMSTILNMAKDNGISVNHSLNKSKGAGTLSGTIKKLQELGFEDVNVNLFDIETCDGMRQVADASNKSISQQLLFDENDYTEMIKEQKILINKFQNKAESLEDENRKLKSKIAYLKAGDN